MAQPDLTVMGSESAAPRLGRYLLGRELGRGFSSVVYAATDTLRGRRVALKVLSFLEKLSPARRQEMAERFQREARAVSRLSHPAIVSIYEVGQAEDGRQFIAMEHLEGETLRARLQRAGPMPAAEALPLMTQIADALQYAHGRGIVHRDVKPDNVFVCADGTAKLMDFGVAHVLADEVLTQTGTVVGSPAYMSPEQINGRPLDGRSDVFSLATMLTETLTGRKPFEAPSIPAVMNQILHKPPHLAGVGSRPLRRALEHALAKNPRGRTPSAGALAEALRRIMPGEGVASPLTTLVMSSGPPRRRPGEASPWEMVGLGGAALGLAALMSLPFLAHRHPATAPVRAVALPAAAPVEAPAPVRRPDPVAPTRRLAFVDAALPPPHRARKPATVMPALREGEVRVTERTAHQPPPLVERTVRPVRHTLALATSSAHFASIPAARPTVRLAGAREERRAPSPALTGDTPDPFDGAQAPRDPDVPDSPPRLTQRGATVYPPAARGGDEQGTVELVVSVNADGMVSGARVTRSSGYPSLDDAAIANVMGWEYDPAFHGGRAVPAAVPETVKF